MKKRYFLVFVLITVTTLCYSQNSSTKKADKHFDRFEYAEAIKEYEGIVKRGNDDAYVQHRLAEAYYNIYDTKGAEKYYGKYLETAGTASAEAYFRYAEMLKVNKRFKESNQAMDVFSAKFPGDSRVTEYKNNPGYLDKLLSNNSNYVLGSKATGSTESSDFGVYEKGDKIYFVSTRNVARKNYAWNQQPTLDIYVADKAANDLNSAILLPGEVNTKYHEGTIAISPDGKTMYFTRNDYSDGDYGKNSQGIGQLKLYTAQLAGNNWGNVKEVPFNSSEYSTAHPALSADGSTLYFSSDRPGGFGMSDLYKVTVNGNGSFGNPVNLGPSINTPGKESFPHVDNQGNLYFSSNGHLGLGGLDVFCIKSGKTALADVKNMGQPINSAADDFAFTYDSTSKTGYVSTNRGSSEGLIANDATYTVKELSSDLDLFVKVINSENGTFIANAEVTVYEDARQKLTGQRTNMEGLTNFTLPGGKRYDFTAQAAGYQSGTASIKEHNGSTGTVVIELDPIQKMITDDQVVLYPILFEYGKADITAEGAMELDRLVAVMKKHLTMETFVRSHTDTRGEEAFNLDLSRRRARSTVQYMMSKGIEAGRISGEGYGESDPKIACGSNCTEEEHQLNRRSEFRIVKK